MLDFSKTNLARESRYTKIRSGQIALPFTMDNAVYRDNSFSEIISTVTFLL